MYKSEQDNKPPPIFVFGSNLAGRHGKGAALYAHQHHGAIYGQGIGLQGNSYAIPTKDAHLKTLPVPIIRGHVEQFLDFARVNPRRRFQITPVGCGLAGYTYEQIAPMFREAPANCDLPVEFSTFLSCRQYEPKR